MRPGHSHGRRDSRSLRDAASPSPDPITPTPGAAEAPSPPPIINLIGERVALGPLRRDLLPVYLRWVNDFEVTRTLGLEGPRPFTWEAEEEWYDRASRKDGDVVFTIYERTTLRPIGNTGLHRVDYRHGTAEFGIVIGEKEVWGRGYGTETTRLMLGYAFGILGLHNVMLRVYADNERAIRAYTRAGFRPIGRRREARQLGGRYIDEIFMDCLATEFEPIPLLR